jgi:sulfatase maturation enzyme AslB (radical SAM superfamily)
LRASSRLVKYTMTQKITWQSRIRTLDQQQFFCTRPFVEIISQVTEIYSPCCYSRGLPSQTTLADELPWDYWSGTEMNQLRSHMLGLADHTDLVAKACEFCLSREQQQIPSPRQRYTERFLEGLVEGRAWTQDQLAAVTERIDSWTGQEPWTALPNSVAVRMRLFGNYCNLRCVSCSPSSSSQIQSEYKKIIALNPEKQQDLRRMGIVNERHMPTQDLVRAQDNVIDNIDKVRSILMIGGEPLLAPGHFDWLDRIVSSGHAQNIELRYQTNLTELHRHAERIFDYQAHFQRIFFMGSIDCFEHRNDYVRWGSTWDQIMSNIGLIKAQGLGITANITTSWLTALWTAQLWDSLKQRWDIDAEINGSVINSPQHMRPRHLPQEFKDTALRRLEYYVKDPARYSVLAAELAQPRDLKQYRLGQQYLETLDVSRKTNWLAVFPEFKHYANK